MKMKPLSVLLLTALALSKVPAQDTLVLPNRIVPSMSVGVSGSSGILTYNYTFANGPGGTQQLWKIWLLPPKPVRVLQIQAPSGWRGRGIVGPEEEPPHIVTWLARVNDISPGATLNGFGLTCGSRPSLARVYAEGYVPLPYVEEADTPSEELDNPFGYGIVFAGVGPTEPDSPLVALALVDSLLAYVDSSYAFGWISNASTRSKYVGFLTRTRNDLEGSQVQAALGRIDTLLTQASQDSGVVLESKAYALLRFNTEYLRDHLSEGPPPITNILQNPGFESGTAPWSFYTNGSGEFSAASPGYQGSYAARIDIGGTGSNVQLHQPSEGRYTLDPHTRYRLSFAAKCNSGHDVNVSLFKHQGGTPNYGLSSYEFDLTSTWATYSVEFTTSGFESPVSDARLMFWLAPYSTAGDQYWFDEIVLGKVGDSVQVPQAPSLTSPADGAGNVSVSPTLTWNSSTGATSYRIQVSGDSSFSSTVFDQSAVEATSYSPSGLSANTTYYWRVNAANSAGTSPWSGARSFTTSSGGGGQNILANGGFEQGALSWSFYTNGSGDLSATSPGYEGSNAARINIGGSGTNVQLNQAPLSLDPNTLYRLSFAAKCNTGHDVNVSLFSNQTGVPNYGLSSYAFDLTSSWNTYSVEFTTSGFESPVSDARLMFWLAPYASAGDQYWFDDIVLAKVGDSVQVPPAPTLASPSDQATGVSENPTLSWNASTGATSYRLQVSTSSSFTATVVDQTGISGTSSAVSGLSASTTYYWRVNATNSAGTSAWSTVRSFVTGTGTGQNLLQNGGFESGTNNWYFYTNADGSFTTGTPAYSGTSSAIVSIVTTGDNMQLHQTGFDLQAGASYQLQFTVKANASRTVGVLVHRNSAYEDFGVDATVNVGTSWSTQTINFTASGFSGQTSDTRLRFWFVGGAQNGDTYWIDDVSLVKQ